MWRRRRSRCSRGRGGRGGCPRFRPYRNRMPEESSAPLNDVQESIKESLKQAKEEVHDAKRTFKEKKREVKDLKKQARRVNKEKKKALKNEKKALKNGKKECRERNNYDAQVTAHIDLGPREVVEGNTMVLKTWRVHNSGSMPWNSNTVAVFVKGCKDMVAEEVLHIGEVNVDGYAMVHCMLVVPPVSGTYNVHYRLQNGMGYFGKPLCTTIVVDKDVPKDQIPRKFDYPEVNHEEQAHQFDELESAVDEQEINEFQHEEQDSATMEDNLSENVEKMTIEEEKVNPAVEGGSDKAEYKYQKQLLQIQELGFKISEDTLKAVLNVSGGDLEKTLLILTRRY